MRMKATMHSLSSLVNLEGLIPFKHAAEFRRARIPIAELRGSSNS